MPTSFFILRLAESHLTRRLFGQILGPHRATRVASDPIERTGHGREGDAEWRDPGVGGVGRGGAPRSTRGQQVGHSRTPRHLFWLGRELKETSDLGEYGARAIHREFAARGHGAVPSVRTIGRVLERRGALDAGRRVRRPPPPAGWYLPEVGAGRAELDSFDTVEGLTFEGGIRIEVLNVVSLHGGLPGSWPQPLVTAKTAVEALVGHWREFGLPGYAQFDNDTVFQGSHHGQDSLGRVVRTCLRLGVIPVFAPPQESGFQAAVENFNGRWQAKVWARFHHASFAALHECSRRYIRAYRQRAAARIEAAPARRPFPAAWRPDLQAHPVGIVIFIRRSSEAGTVSLLGRTFEVDALWPHRLVRCDMNLAAQTIRFHALRRREPHYQAFLHEAPYSFPRRRFVE